MKLYPRIQKTADALFDSIVSAEPEQSHILTAKLFKRLTRQPKKLAKKAYLNAVHS